MKLHKRLMSLSFVLAFSGALLPVSAQANERAQELDQHLKTLLSEHQFTGRMQEKLNEKLGRPIDEQLAETGRLLFHDNILGLHGDNSCAGCHAARVGFGDTQSVAIGIDNNGIVGPLRFGPRNQRRSPMLLNNAFYPALMLNSRFASLSGDPFDNSGGYEFPLPEGSTLNQMPNLLTAQAFIPPIERTEMTGFESHVPETNDEIREEVARRVGKNYFYRTRFGRIFPEVRAGSPVTYEMIARAIAEFEFTLTFADAPIDQFARGDSGAMTAEQKRGAVLFFGEAGCVQCHAVSGRSNEMFSDFKQHVAGVPPIAPIRTWVSNITWDGPSQNEDYGLEQVTGNPNDRYAFRTSPLRNVALQATFFHNGAFTDLESALRFHVNTLEAALMYRHRDNNIDFSLHGMGPLDPVLERLDPLLVNPIGLTEEDFNALLAFVRDGLHDPRATPRNLRSMIPYLVPGTLRPTIFQ